MTTYTDAYLREAIADEVALAKLLGYRNIGVGEITPTMYIKGDRFREGSIESRLKIASLLPKWRRAWDGVGELIAICNLCIITCDERVSVGAGAGKAFTGHAEVSQHPSKDHAIRFAMCKAAIAYLSNESSTTKEKS